jgi:hypothetical protein
LTTAITAAALVAVAGFAYAQSTATSPPSDPAAQGTTTQQAQPSTGSSSTMPSQPSTSSGTSLDNSATPSGMTTPQPRADRN